MKFDKIPVLVIVGPTAVGKTQLSIDLAQQLNAEIVSADSMQVYRGMNIGTAKPSAKERQGIVHHLLDVVDPDQVFNVADYLTLAETAIEDIAMKNKLPLVTGGTGLYINALIDGFLFPEQGADPKIRATLMQRAQEDKVGLYQELERVDPEAAAKLHPNDVRRVTRALEVYYATGEPISKLQGKASQQESKYLPLFIGLTRARQQLYQRVDRRVDQMIEQGLIEEVRELLATYPQQPTALQALGYKEIASFLTGIITFEEAVYLLKRDTRRYAKRQLSWFKRDPRINWYDVGVLAHDQLLEKIIEKCREFRLLSE